MKHLAANLLLVSAIIGGSPLPADGKCKSKTRACNSNNRPGGTIPNLGRPLFNPSLLVNPNPGPIGQPRQECSDTPVGRPQVSPAVPEPAEDNDPLADVLESGEWTVFVQHPVSGEFVKAKTFGNELDALQYKSKIEQRYFVTYRQPGDAKLRFKEAPNTSQANALAQQLRQDGNQIVGAARVSARIDDGQEEPLLAELLDSADPPEPEKIELESTKDEGDTTSETAEEPTTDTTLDSLVGIWQAVARTANGELTTIELKLDANGWATLTLPTNDGGRTSIERRVALENRELKLEDKDSSLSLGKLASVDAERLTLERADGRITFVRP